MVVAVRLGQISWGATCQAKARKQFVPAIRGRKGCMMIDGTDSYNLAERCERARRLFHETRAIRGWGSAVILLYRILLSKMPLLLRHIWAARRTAEVREAVAQGRIEACEAPYLAIAISGGLGDTLVIARFVRDIAIHVGEIRFDVFSPTPKHAAWVFRYVPGFRTAYYDVAFNRTLFEYDLSIRANQSAVVYQEHVRWDAVRHNHRLMEVIDSLIRFRPKIDVFVAHHPWLDHFLARTAVFAGASRRDFLHAMAGLRYSSNRLSISKDSSIVGRLGLSPGEYVTVHNGFDPGFVISAPRATKCYPHFGAVVALLKDAMPNVIFVQVGTTTSKPIAECDLILLNRTSLDEVAGLLSRALLHLDNEGGLVHLAACLGTRSAVVFGPTPHDYFGYPDNINITPPVCGGCWYMTRTWMDGCPKGHDTPVCLTEQDPRAVADRVLVAVAEATGACVELPPHPLEAGVSLMASAARAAA
jgi:Glycosyltransferase family 9 (heptosyltransferase)